MVQSPFTPNEGNDMSRFNSTITPPKPNTMNRAGGAAFSLDVRTELASALLTSFLKDMHYETGDERITRIRGLVDQDPEFAAQAAVYARNEYGMRSVSHVVAAQIALTVRGERWLRPFYAQVVRRPDDMTEILAAYAAFNGSIHPVPNALKRGFADAFAKFDDYQLAKYQAKGKQVSLIDVVNLVRPFPVEQRWTLEHPKHFPKSNAQALAGLVAGDLRQHNTWEDELSHPGDRTKAQIWNSLVREEKLPYFALLRNLRNLAEHAGEEEWLFALEQLVDPQFVSGSMVLPFRFITALQAMQQATEPPSKRRTEAHVAISRAADISVGNLPDLAGRTRIAVDMSGSMSSRRVNGDGLPVIQIAALFAAALSRKLGSSAELMLFDTEIQHLSINPTDSLLTVSDMIVKAAKGGGTNMDLAFEGNEAFDRFIILSDMQAWTNCHFHDAELHRYNYYYGGNRQAPGRHRTPSEPDGGLSRYRKRMGITPAVFTFDLTGYGDAQFPQEKRHHITGWSEKSLRLIGQLDEGREGLVDDIARVVLT